MPESPIKKRLREILMVASWSVTTVVGAALMEDGGWRAVLPVAAAVALVAAAYLGNLIWVIVTHPRDTH